MKINENAILKIEKRKKYLEMGKGYLTGYSSIDMPWLKYYTEEQILAPIPHMTAYDYLRILNNNNQNNIAIEFKGEKTTYLELFQKITETAKALSKIGVIPREIITVMLPACPEEVYLLYAIDMLGACANFIYIGTPIEEAIQNMDNFHSNKLIILEDLLHQSNSMLNNSKYQIITKSYSNEMLDGTNSTTWDKFIENGLNTELPLYERTEDEPLFIAKTGGTTGKPKSVVLSDRGFNLQVQQHLNAPQKYGIGDRWVRLWPLFSASAAVSSSHLPLCAGMHMIIEQEFSLQKIGEIVLKNKPSHMPFIASGMDALINSIGGQDISFMKSLGVGGAPMTEDEEKKADAFLQKNNVEEHVGRGYGLTENSSGATAGYSSKTTEFRGVGIPQLNTIVSIFEPNTDIEKKYNEEGEVCIISSTFMLGYYNDMEATNTVFKKHSDGNVWLHTGDLGSMNDNGQLFIKGRIKRVISLYDGHKIYPLEIESLIECLEEIEKAIVVPEEDPNHKGAFRPCCFITLSKNISADILLDKINNSCLKGLPKHSKISTIHIMKEIPKTPIGKVDIKQLESEALKLSKKHE